MLSYRAHKQSPTRRQRNSACQLVLLREAQLCSKCRQPALLNCLQVVCDANCCLPPPVPAELLGVGQDSRKLGSWRVQDVLPALLLCWAGHQQQKGGQQALLSPSTCLPAVCSQVSLGCRV